MDSQLAILCLVLVLALTLVQASSAEKSLNLGQTNHLGPPTGRMRETETILSVGDWAPVDSFDSNTYSRWVSVVWWKLSLFQDFFFFFLLSHFIISATDRNLLLLCLDLSSNPILNNQIAQLKYKLKTTSLSFVLFSDALAARVQNSVASDDYSLDITPAVRFV